MRKLVIIILFSSFNTFIKGQTDTSFVEILEKIDTMKNYFIRVNFLNKDESINMKNQIQFIKKLKLSKALLLVNEGFSYELFLNRFISFGTLNEVYREGILCKTYGTKKFYKQFILALRNKKIEVKGIGYERKFKAAFASADLLYKKDKFGNSIEPPSKIRSVIEDDNSLNFLNGSYPSFMSDTIEVKKYLINLQNNIIKNRKNYLDYFGENLVKYETLIEGLIKSIEYYQSQKSHINSSLNSLEKIKIDDRKVIIYFEVKHKDKCDLSEQIDKFIQDNKLKYVVVDVK